jgi:hypothetical protein
MCIVGMLFQDADEVLEACALALYTPVRVVVEVDVDVNAAEIAEEWQAVGVAEGAKDAGGFHGDGEVGAGVEFEGVGV